MPERLPYARDRGPARTHIRHVVTAASWPARNQRILRDHLRSHPARYAELKWSPAAGGRSHPDYTRAKTELIQDITDRARAARGLPPVPVWEEQRPLPGLRDHTARP